MKKIAVITATRAEYGLLKPLIELVYMDPDLELQLLVTGSHLSPYHGNTWEQIVADGFPITKKIEMLLGSDSPQAISKSMGLAQISFAQAFDELKPDVVVILGDRYEMLAIASIALIFNIPIAHLHGGELTFGAIDDNIRHALTKLSNLHFTATEKYRSRVIQMGEDPNTVFNVGAIGLDSIKRVTLLDRSELQNKLNVKFKKQNFIITFHPETKSNVSVKDQIDILIEVLDKFEDTLLVFTGANADTYGNVVNKAFLSYVNRNPEKACFFYSLGQQIYFSCLKHFDLVLGNSSSGIIEAPYFKIPVVNIGNRQEGRFMCNNIINCSFNKNELEKAIFKAISPLFRTRIDNLSYPFGTGNTANKILKILKSYEYTNIKKFYDM